MSSVRLFDNSYYCQRAIYIADILNRFVVCNPSLLKYMSLYQLRQLFYSKEDFLICI